MVTYRVFTGNGTPALVSDEDLDRAALVDGPLPTELANAAARAGRQDLAPRLLATLGPGPRTRRLAAARALLALEHGPAADALEALARAETDNVIARMFAVIALRARGIDRVRDLWERADDPELCGFVPSLYSTGPPGPDPADLDLMVDMLDDYVARRRPWIRAIRPGQWRDGVAILVLALCDGTPGVWEHLDPGHAGLLEDVLNRIASSPAEHDIKAAAKRALRDRT